MQSRTRISIWDIDGVLADVRHRVHWVERKPKNWVAFFEAAPDDPVLPAGRVALERAIARGLTIVYLTGRPEWCRRDTVAWLKRHGFPDGPLHMRDDHDHRPARLIKLATALRLAAAADIVEMHDDDDRVVDVLAAAGLPIIHATWMDGGTSGVDAILQEIQEDEGRT